MTVCLRCGKQLGETAKFCGGCGYPVKCQQTVTNNQAGRQEPRQQNITAVNAAGNNVSTQMMTREQLIAEIDRMLIYFSRVQDIYDEYDRCAENQDAEQDSEMRNYDEDDISTLFEFLFGFVGELITHDYQALAVRSLVFGILFGLAGLFMLISQIWKYYIYIAVGCFIICGFLCYLMVILLVENNKQKRQERIHMESVRAKLEKYHGDYGYCLVTFENANPRILRRVREYLVSGQACTLNDALRLAYD